MAEEVQTVLLIEDNPGDARLIREYVREGAPGRYVVEHKSRLADGLAFLEKSRVALILLDLSLPDSSGLASVRQIRRCLSPAPPIVVLTGLSDETVALRAVQEGAQDYLLKSEIDGRVLARAMSYALERHRLQAALQRHAAQIENVNRALNVLSGCNQVLVRAREEQQLLDDICQIIVQQGGYRMAWIGIAGNGAEKRVEPVAAAGFAAGYLETVKITWDESARGCGPAGKAIRTNQPVVVSDVDGDPGFAVWAENATERGYHSLLALPLLFRGKRYGVLVVYAAERNAFAREELALFGELVDDVAYGLEALQNRRRRREAERQLSERERHYRALFEHALDIVTILDPDGTIRYKSRSVEHVLGYQVQELVGRSVLEFVRPDDRPRIRQLLAQVHESPGRVVRLEVRWRHKNGTWRTLEVAAKNLLAEPAVGGLIINARDVTERRAAESALKQNRERLIVLHEIEQAILAARSPRDTAEATLDHLRNLIPYRRGAVSLFDHQHRQLTVLAGKSTANNVLRAGERLVVDEGRGLQELKQGRHILIDGHTPEAARTPLQRQLWQEDGCSSLSIPLLSRDTLLGELALVVEKQETFSHNHVQIAYEVAASLSVALQNALLYEETERRAQELAALAQVSAAMRSAEESQDILSIVAAQLAQLLGVEHTAIALHEPGTGQLVLKLVQGTHSHLTGRRLSAEEGMIGRVFKSGELFVTTELPDALPDLPDDLVAGGWAAACLPLSATSDVIGVLWVMRREVLGERDLRLLRATVDMVGNALSRSTMHEQTLAHARQIEQIIETVPDGMLVLDGDGRLSLANRAAREFLPLLTQARVGEIIRWLGDRSLAALLEPPAGDVPWHELEIREPHRIFEIVARPIASGVPAGATVLMLHDATEERRHQRYLQAQERLATVGQLAAGIAHDFNNIMAVITLYSQSLERDPDLPKRLQYLNTINQQAQHAASLITQILDFSRASVMQRHRVDLLPFVKEMVKLLERTVPERVSISFDAESDIYPVHADPTRLQQMLMNLAVNARDAMPEGGQLSLALARLSLSPEERAPLPRMAAGQWVELQVADNGAGISRENLPHIFEPFFTTKEPGQGTGLGLAQVYGIVKHHGGEIAVESQVGMGTRFTIYLPALATETQSGSGGEGDAEPVVRGNREQILLVEDNEGTREAIADILEMFNYRVQALGDGQEALCYFGDHPGEIDLVISDMVMPQVDGLALFRRLQAIEPEVKVVIITGYPLEEEGKNLLEEGIVAWMQKPFTASRVAEVVQAALHPDEALQAER